MHLPFTTDQFLQVFRDYNLAIWPLQIIAYLVGIAAVAGAFARTPGIRRLVWGALACFWLWNGVAYHLLHFSAINPAAYLFGTLFVLQGLFFLRAAITDPDLSFRPILTVRSLAGGLLTLYAMVVYPLLGTWLGHGFPSSPGFGIAPCPKAIFTFGLLLWADPKPPVHLLVIPVVWAVVASSAAITLGMREDFGLPVAALVTVGLLLPRQKHTSPQPLHPTAVPPRPLRER
jgi:hypothetical protein